MLSLKSIDYNIFMDIILFQTNYNVRLRDIQNFANKTNIRFYFHISTVLTVLTLRLKYTIHSKDVYEVESYALHVVYMLLHNLAIRLPVTGLENIKRVMAGYLSHKPHKICLV